MGSSNSKNSSKNESAPRGSFVFYLPLVFAMAVLMDQATKYLAFTSGFGEFLNHFSPVMGKVAFKNFQFAFSLPVPTLITYLIYFILLAGIGWYLKNNFLYLDNKSKFAWTLILAGAVSNIGERLALGYVRDFIYILTGIFNLADLFIILGILILLVSSKKFNTNSERPVN